MKDLVRATAISGLLIGSLALPELHGQPSPGGSNPQSSTRPIDGRPPEGGPDFGGPPPFGWGGFGGGGPQGPGGLNREIKVVKDFDQDGDGRLNREERRAARESLKNQRASRRFGGPGGPGGRRGGFGPGAMNREPPQPGRRLTPAEVKAYPDTPVYDPRVVRTFFLEFENADWEQELADLNNTDVEVPAQVTVDGRTYPEVGVHFRGTTSFLFVGEGRKRPLNLTFDFVRRSQNFGGYRTFNFLNAHEDPSYLRTMLYLEVARDYLPAAKANFVRVVINGECWGIYTSVQQFNKDFVQDGFGTAQGARWKVPGSPRGRAGLEYLGDDPESYRQLYTLKTKDRPEVWADFIALCRTLNDTETEKLPAAIEPRLDVDETLRFLAVDVGLINSDGYWIRSSDYNIYQHPEGRFHVLPHDVNEAFSPGGGPGFRGGPGGGGIEVDPLVGLNDSTKPLRSRLLAVPQYRARYLGYVRDLAERWLDWDRKLGPLARQYHDLIAEDVKAETRKLCSSEAFLRSLDGSGSPADPAGIERPGRGGEKMPLREFAQRRRAFLLNHPEVRNAPLPAAR